MSRVKINKKFTEFGRNLLIRETELQSPSSFHLFLPLIVWSSRDDDVMNDPKVSRHQRSTAPISNQHILHRFKYILSSSSSQYLHLSFHFQSFTDEIGSGDEDKTYLSPFTFIGFIYLVIPPIQYNADCDAVGE
jgi:hypothetical protein